uniref:Uncharacterized protein n=1 Tax=Rhizophora mucronata TaxID=61149 RepID=A0A2P2QW83_RHIMU
MRECLRHIPFKQQICPLLLLPGHP